jgi:hypothetical protein
MNKRLLCAAILAAGVVASPAAAVMTVGSAAVAIVGISADTSSIGVGTTFTNTGSSIVGSAFGDFAPTVGQTVVISPMTASVGSAFTFTSSFGNFTGTVQNASALGTADDRTVSAFVLGTFSPLGTLAAFDPGPASATFSFTQTGEGTAVSGSFSLSSPPSLPPQGVIPEPGVWSMLIVGFGMVGVSARRRKSRVNAA